MTPNYNDDWVYSFIWGSKQITLVTDVFDIIKSQYSHYFNWGGRTVDHFIAQFLLMLDQNSSAVIKSIVFVVYLLSIFRISNICFQKYNFVLLLILLSYILFFTLSFVQSILWTTGSANYLFGTTIVLIFIYPYCRFYIDGIDRYDAAIICNVVFFVGGVLTGWTNENTIAALIFGILIIILYIKYIDKNKIPIWMIIGFSGLLLGFILMVAAPGNLIRTKQELINQGIQDFSKYDLLRHSIRSVLNYYLYEKKIICLIVLYIISSIIVFTNRKIVNIRKIYLSVIIFIIANLACIVMLAAPLFPARATFSMTTFLIIANGVLLSEIMTLSKMYKYLVYLLSFLCLIFLVIRYNQFYSNSLYIYNVELCRKKIIQKNIKNNNYNIILEPIDEPYNTIYYDFSQDSTSIFNQMYSVKYGLKSIRIKYNEKDTTK